KDLRHEDLLGETTTDQTGSYEIWYSDHQFRRPDKRRADLVVRAYAPHGPASGEEERLLAESSVIFGAQTIEKVRLWVEGGPEHTWSEYEQLMSEVEPLLGTTPITDLVEDDKRHDITFLSGQIGQSAQRVATLVVAHKLAARI